MRCTNCSDHLQPVVAIDIDGTLGDYHGHFLRYACQYLGLELDKLLELSLRMYDGGEPFREYCAREFNISDQQYRDIKLAYRQGAMKRSMPIMNGSAELCGRIRKRAELWLTTTRPYLSLDGVIKDTQFWLELHNIRCDGLLFDDDKYMTMSERIDTERVVAVVDDIDEMYDSASQVMYYGTDATILMANQYNRAMWEGRTVAHNALQVFKMVNERLELWEAKHAQP